MADYNLKAIITGDSSGYEASVKKAKQASESLSSTIHQVSKLMKTAFSVVGISTSISAIKSFGTECVKSAESANKSLNILNNTLKVTGASAWTTSEDLVKMSEEIAHSTNYTVGEIQDMESVLLGFKNITGDTFREASEAITDMATVMGMDLKSAVQTVGKALDDPIKGLDSLRRQGFAFTEEQKEMLATLVENGKQLEAQKIILDELNTTYGGASKSAQSSFDKQKDAVIEFKEAVGNQLLPVLNAYAETSATMFEGLTDKIKTIDFAQIASDIEYVVDVSKAYFKVFYDNAKSLFNSLYTTFEGAELNFTSFKDTIYNVLNDVYKQIQISFGFINALIKGDWKLAWEYAKLYVLDICKKILDGLDELLKKMPNLVNGAIKGLNKYYEAQDKVLIEWLHLPEKYFKAPRLGTYNGTDYIDTSKLQSQIDEATKAIESATGKCVAIDLVGLEKIEENKAKYQNKAEEGQVQFTNATEVEVKKRVKIEEKEEKTKFEKMKEYAEQYAKKIKDIFSKIASTIKNVFSAIGNIFNKALDIFNFNPDDALTNLLKVEDAILTFFVDTLPRLPSFMSSVVYSIKTLLKTVKTVLQGIDLKGVITSVLSELSNNLPEMVSDLLDILVLLVDGAVDSLVMWVTNGNGLQVLLDLILKIQTTIEKLVTDNIDKIVTMLEGQIDNIANFIARSMASANRTLPKIVQAILRLIKVLIDVIAKAFENDDFVNSIVDSLIGVIDEIINILPKLITSIVKLIFAIINALIPKLPEIVSKIVTEIGKILSTDTGEILKAMTDGIAGLLKKVFTLDFWVSLLSSFGEALGQIIYSAFKNLNLGSIFGKTSGGSSGGTTTGSTAGDVALGFATGGISTLGHAFGWWAKGTNNAPAGLSIVGEAGPELVKFRGGEQVLNNRNTNKALANMGGSTNNFNVTFNNLQDTTAFAMMQQLKAYNRSMAINGVI